MALPPLSRNESGVWIDMKKTLNKKGLTLMELIVAIMFFSIILTMVATIVTPVLRTYARANEFAEANTLLDNISILMKHEIGNAVAVYPLVGNIEDDILTIDYGIHSVNFALLPCVNGSGVYLLKWQQLPDPRWVIVVDRTLYGNKRLGMDWEVEDGVFRLNLELVADAWSVDRQYVSRPIGLASFD